MTPIIVGEIAGTDVHHVADRTLIKEKSGGPIMWLDRPLVLPIGAEIELSEEEPNVRVTRVRLLASGTVCLDVESVDAK